jgi:hypothetical protein
MCPIIVVRDREGVSTALAGPWLRVQPEQPGVLLLRRLGSRQAQGSGGRHVRTHWFRRAHLPMSGRGLWQDPCLCASVSW